MTPVALRFFWDWSASEPRHAAEVQYDDRPGWHPILLSEAQRLATAAQGGQPP